MVLSVKLAAVVVAAAMAAPAPATITVYPRVTRNNVIVRATVERHPDNRKLVIEVDNQTTFFDSTDFQLDGEASPRVFPAGGRMVLENLPSGEYEARAIVYKQGNEIRYKAVTTFRVIGLDTPPEDW